MVIRGRFAVLMQNSVTSLVFSYPKYSYTSLDSQGWMLHIDLKYVKVANEIEVHATLEYKNCNFQFIF